MKELEKVLEGLREPLLETLKAWVRIPSIKGDRQEGAPFGPVVRQMLDKAMADCEALGFPTENFDGYIGHATLGEGSDEDALALLAHVDIVPVGDGWQREPFGAQIEAGRLYGRGTSDDKGPAVAALYAMAAVKQAGIPLKRKVRLILGCDEESGWEDIAHYHQVAHMPRMGFSPDATYPVINIEKGMYGLELSAPLAGDGLQLIDFCTGERPNVVPGLAKARVRGGEELVEKTAAISAHYGWPVMAQHEAGVVTLTATGITGHAAFPELGRNAIGQMLITLRDLGATGAIKLLADTIGTGYDAAGLNAAIQDSISGPLTCNLGIIRAQAGRLTARLDIRYPLMTSTQMLESLIRQSLPGVDVKVFSSKTPHHVPASSPLVQALLDAYHEVTGLPKATIAIGGGTYARSLKEGVAFGALFPGEADIAHQADEYIDIENLYKNMRIFAYAIVKLAGR
ncbi:MAG: Sapep family Mn(2+)-dependent dipeptidase [Christensenellales bacterium]